MNWLLKDPKLKADYEQYLRNGPGRWLTNKFDTTDPAAYRRPAESVEAAGELELTLAPYEVVRVDPA
mgnify:CR=1 FL=1